MTDRMFNSQQDIYQKVQDDRYSHLNLYPEERPGSTPEKQPQNNPSQYPARHPDEVPQKDNDEIPDEKNLYDQDKYMMLT